MDESTAFTTVVEVPLTICHNVCANNQTAEWWIKDRRDDAIFMNKDSSQMDVLSRMIEIRMLRNARRGTAGV